VPSPLRSEHVHKFNALIHNEIHDTAFSGDQRIGSVSLRCGASRPSQDFVAKVHRAMAVLAKDEIFKAIATGDIKITPYDASAVGTASIDLTLGNEFRFFNQGFSVVPVKEDTDFRELTTKVHIKDGDSYLLLPGCACLGITRERVTLSSKYCGLLEGRSRFARLGLFVHITAGFMNPGIDNCQVLEIYNASNNALALWPGTKICQFIFIKMEGEAKYDGKFQGDKNSL